MQDFSAPRIKDPNVDIGLLSINGLQSTDLMCVTDRRTQLTLLYIPGNSSPIHRFDNPQKMKTWLAEQATDPVKRASLLTHFSLKDQADKSFSDGVRQSLEGMANWSNAQASGSAFLSGLNGWVPDRFITVDPLRNDPLKRSRFDKRRGHIRMRKTRSSAMATTPRTKCCKAWKRPRRSRCS